MKMLFRSILSASRKRRRFMAGLALRLLQMIHDIEDVELSRLSDMLDELNVHTGCGSIRDYHAAEDDYLDCETSLEFLSSAIDDLGYAYEMRF